MKQETAEQLSAELKRTIRALDDSLDRIATAATQTTAALHSLADLTARIDRMVNDPPAETHTLDIHDGNHEETSEIIGGEEAPDNSPTAN